MKTYRVVFQDDNKLTFITVPWAKTRIGARFWNTYAFIKFKKIKRKEVKNNAINEMEL